MEIKEDRSKNDQIIESFIERSKSPVNRTKHSTMPPEHLPQPSKYRRPSQLIGKETFKSRGSTPVDLNKGRSKSPAFGSRN